MILCVTFARSPHPLLPLVCAILKPLPAWRVPRFIQQPNLFGRFNSPYLGAKLREVRSRVSQRTLKARLEAVASIDVSEKLRRVSVPTLYLRGRHDRVVSRASCEYIRKIHPTVEVAELDAPHLLLQTAPHAAAGIISEFLKKSIQISNPS